MRLIDADKAISELKSLPEQERLEYMGVYDLLKSVPTVDAKPLSKDFARFVTKSIASLFSELQLDLPSTIYESIEYTLMKGHFAEVETFVINYIQNYCQNKIDDESVVRCKDCMHWKQEKSHTGNNGASFCKCGWFSSYQNVAGAIYTSRDDYCSYGTKTDDEVDNDQQKSD